MAGEPLLAVRGLVKRFGGLLALNGVGFEVARGEIFGVIGPNGAGKTTLFGCLVGALRPSAGEVRFAGARIDGRACHEVARRGLVRTHQIVRPFRAMTVAENVSVGAHFGVRGLRGAAAARVVADALERTGLAPRAGVPAGALTIGELKRLEIARALAARPAALCLDEVMGGLNPGEIRGAMELVREIRAAGVTVLMIEHHVHAVVGLSDRIMVLDFGTKVAEGPPADVVRDPAVIAAYLGADSAYAAP